MGVRREGREAAVQYLYLRDLNGDSDLPAYYKFRGLSPSARRFCTDLVQGAIGDQEAIDEAIRRNTQNYELGRISVVDRNVLRVAIYEMLHCAEIPPVVSINEAIE
ncbi:MAG: transcription antitermination protein NusB, partial [Terrimicrobiaceae bacterium]